MSNLIIQAAIDYDMDEYIVEKIYDKYYERGEFYEQLEKFITNRSAYLF